MENGRDVKRGGEGGKERRGGEGKRAGEGREREQGREREERRAERGIRCCCTLYQRGNVNLLYSKKHNHYTQDSYI